MITKEQWRELTNSRINSIDSYLWDCYGPNACIAEYHLPLRSVSKVFDMHTNEIFQVEVHDYEPGISYRLINPKFKQAYFAEVKRRGSKDEAYDGTPFIDLEVDEDFLEKAEAIMKGLPYSKDISIPLNIPDKELLELFKAAHTANVTFNQYITSILERAMLGGDLNKQRRFQQYLELKAEFEVHQSS